MTGAQAASSAFPVISTGQAAGGRGNTSGAGKAAACAPEAACARSGSPGRGGPGAPDSALIWCRAKAARSRAGQLQEQAQALAAQAQARAQAIEDSARACLRGQPLRVRQNLLQRSEYARLLARLETMPVIEQAKGILMAQSRCTGAEAFDLLRRASQRGNVPVRELAAQIVAKTARASPGPEAGRAGDPAEPALLQHAPACHQPGEPEYLAGRGPWRAEDDRAPGV